MEIRAATNFVRSRGTHAADVAAGVVPHTLVAGDQEAQAGAMICFFRRKRLYAFVNAEAKFR